MILKDIESLSDAEKLALVQAVQESVAANKAKQTTQEVGQYAKLVVDAIKKIKTDLEERYAAIATDIEIKSAKIRDGKDGLQGPKGEKGDTGLRGLDGANGRDGRDGVDGIDGVDGNGVTDARIDFDGSLIITLSNGNEINAGDVVPLDVAEKIKVIGNGGGTSQYVLDAIDSLQAQIDAVSGGLSYRGTWNASTNTPTLTSSTGTSNYYYVVSVSGSTNLDGITDWVAGDWAIYNGTAWQKIDQTNLVTSVNSQTGAVVLTYSDVGAFPATATTGTGSVVLQTSPTINTPTISGATIDGTAPYLNFTPAAAPSYVEGRLFYDSTAHTLTYYNDNSQMSVNIGQEQIVRVRNQTGSTIADGTVVYVNGATGNTPTVSLAIATSFSTADIIGVTTTSIANNGFGYVTISGLVNGLDTSAFTEGDAVFLSATTAGTFTTTEPTAPNYSVQVGVILRANPSVGTLLVSLQQISVEVAHIVGTLLVAQGGTGATSASGARTNLGLVIGTDVLAPNGSAASLTNFPTFNQNTTGTAASTPKLLSTNFTIEESGGKLLFKYGATTIASMSSTGVITSATNIVSNGTP